MQTRSDVSRITIDLPKESHKKLKAMAALLGKSMKEVVIESIEDHFCGVHYPNKKTQQVIKKIAAGKGLVKAANAKDLFKKLGI